MSDSRGAGTEPQKGRLGQRLVARGAITEAQLTLALKEMKRTGARLGETLIALGFTTEQEITASLASQAGVDHVDLGDVRVTDEVLNLLGESFCRENSLLPLEADASTIRIAMANTFDVVSVDAVSQRTGRAVEVVAASEPDVLAALDRAFGGDATLSLEGLIQEALEASQASDEAELRGVVRERPVVRLVDSLLRDAVRRGATDVHVEPEARIVRVRNRVDGVLVAGPTLPKEVQTAVAARVKLMANLDISETRLPQDGKINTEIDRRPFNVRVSTLPTVHGENVVMRVLDKGRVVLGLRDLGFSESNHEAFAAAVPRPAGIVLVTGPTGSGKTTTLYAALSTINAMELKIATLEDPVEYELPVIRQSQVNLQAGLTFGVGLRSLLRQDPDVMLVGEMRDAETVEVALRAAMTGHLVLSTLHTNSAAGALPRLLNMGVEAYLLASTLVAVQGQRLVRRLCEDCRTPDEKPDATACQALGIDPASAELYRAEGCRRCFGTGYRGRRAVAEVLPVTPAISRAITRGAQVTEIVEISRGEGMVSMFEEARSMVLTGETSVGEALRHTWDAVRSGGQPGDPDTALDRAA